MGNACRCQDSCQCCQANACCGACRDLCCRDFYARPPIIRTLQPVGGAIGAPPTATALSVTRPPTVVQQTTTIQSQGFGPGVMIGQPQIAGPPALGSNYGYPVGASRVGGPLGNSVGPGGITVGPPPPVGGYTGPIVPRDPRVPMAGIDMY